MDFIANHPPGRALDVGCGSGTNVITLVQHGWQVTGVDFARRAIGIAREKTRNAGVDVDLQVDDATRLTTVRGSFDLILDIGCFHGLDQHSQDLYVDNLVRLLGPGGTYLMYGFFRQPQESGPGMLEADLKRLDAVFELVKRQEGSERDRRPSAWLTYRKKTD